MVKVDNGVFDYTSKEESRIEGPFTFGKIPERNQSAKGKIDWTMVRRNAEEFKFDEIDDEAYVKYWGNIKKIAVESLKPKQYDTVRGIWIYGHTGVGKSHYARTNFGDDVYYKAQNKWWDGYRDQSIAILDDLDSDCLSHYLKIWADKWACHGEIKGSTVPLNYKHLIVTSNFTIQQLFEKLPAVSIEAIRRRFRVINIYMMNGERVIEDD